MKAIILMDRNGFGNPIIGVFVLNELSEEDQGKLSSVADYYDQQIVVRDITPVRNVNDIIEEIHSCSDED